MGIKLKIGARQQLIPPGEYSVRVAEIKDSSFAGKRKVLEFIFEIVDGPHRGIMLRGFVNAHYESFSPYTKLRQWAAILTKEDLAIGSELDTDIFLNTVFKVAVETKKSRKTGNEFSNVTNILGVVCDLG